MTDCKKMMEAVATTTQIFVDCVMQQRSGIGWAVILSQLEMALAMTPPVYRETVTNAIQELMNVVGDDSYEDQNDYLSSDKATEWAETKKRVLENKISKRRLSWFSGNPIRNVIITPEGATLDFMSNFEAPTMKISNI